MPHIPSPALPIIKRIPVPGNHDEYHAEDWMPPKKSQVQDESRLISDGSKARDAGLERNIDLVRGLVEIVGPV